jgi:hypothetical protein
VIGGETYLATTDYEAFQLDGVADAVWSLIDGARTEDDIAREVAGRYGQDISCVLPDVQAFLQELAKSGLVEY